MSRYALLFITAVLTFFSDATFAEGPKRAKLILLTDHSIIQAGDTLQLGALFNIDPKWHIYWKYPGKVGLPTKLSVKGSEFVTSEDILWPLPEHFHSSGIDSFGYSNEVMLILPLKINPRAEPGRYPMELSSSWLNCSDEQCIRQKEKLPFELVIGKKSEPSNTEQFNKWRNRIPQDLTKDSRFKNIDIKGNLEPEGEFKLSFKTSLTSKSINWIPAPPAGLNIGKAAISFSDSVVNISFPAYIKKGKLVSEKSFESLVIFSSKDGEKTGFVLRIPLAQ